MLPPAIAILLVVSSAATTARGQESPESGNPNSYSYAADNSPSVRERLFAELARDVEAMEQRLGIVKRVIRLVSPSVVHIQAKKNSSYGDSYSTVDSIEEAGSGILSAWGRSPTSSRTGT
jgi:hypothetical protein